jgi:nicotinate-nucleotide pyrophosphorylase (carboxylating)
MIMSPVETLIANDIIQMLYQDIGFEDLTTNALISPGLEIKAKIIAKQDGVAAGVDLAYSLFRKFSLAASPRKKDGEKLKNGEVILEIEGDARTILTLERTVLNLLMRMSGIATLTSHLVEKAKKVNPHIIVAGTRKTTPGLQILEKKAIRTGGGDPHRYRLDDCVLIKDNHLALVGDVKTAVERARKYASFTKKIEVEVENREDALAGADAGADIIMLDNMAIPEIKKVLSSLDHKGLRNKVLIEVSGGINPENVVEYVKTGVDVISAGFITHSAPALDMSLEIF